mgnify:CR=1 FL=1
MTRTPPSDFCRRLETQHHGMLRIRWSCRLNQWQIEEKVGRALGDSPIPISEAGDDMLRAKDGYTLLMPIAIGDRMPCPRCGSTVPVPVNRTAELRCLQCMREGRDGRYAAGFYALDGDILLDHLQRLGKDRSGLHRVADANNQKRLNSGLRAVSTHGEAGMIDNWRRMVGVESVGYTGKELK